MNDSSANSSANSSSNNHSSAPNKARTTSHLVRLVRSSFLAIGLVALGAALGFCEEPNHSGGWSTSYDTAVANAEESGKPIMLVFTGSDWCVWCKKLDQDILKKPEFLAWSNMNVAKVEIDFPQNSVLPTEIASQNDALMAKYGQHVQTFPTVLFVDSKGTVLAKTGYINSDVNNWIDNAKQILPETKFAAQSGNDVIGQFVGN